MTATVKASGAPPRDMRSAQSRPATAPPDGSRRRRRWPRILLPVGVVTLFWAVGVMAYTYQEPRLADPGTLSPVGAGRHGSSQLADLLTDRGVEIERVTSSADALRAARGRDATILVPAPDLLDGSLVRGLLGAEGLHRVVLVRPGLLGRFSSGLAVGVAHTRWASTVVEPACSHEVAERAGPALVLRDRYVLDEAATIFCYQGGVVGARVLDVEVVLVGATDPFRNDRVAEAGNAELATGLLSRHDLVVWVDVHTSEIRPQLPDLLPDYERREQDRTRTGEPLLDAFPVQLWTVFVVLVGAGLLLAIARARRLGPPVPEPLPVIVPAAEAVTGRGRLYRRIRARGTSLATLRGAALARLARAMGGWAGQEGRNYVMGGWAGQEGRDYVVDPLARSPERALATPGPQRDAFVSAVAARSGRPEAEVATVLFGPLPQDDTGLVAAAADLDRLIAAVLPPAVPAQTRSPEQTGGSS